MGVNERTYRAAYLGVQMSFRLVRGKPLPEIIEHYRKRNAEQEGKHREMADRYNCKFDSGPNSRERGTLQSATFLMKNNPAPEYGDAYHIVVRCERQWYPDEFAIQRFEVVVEISHAEDIRLYQRVKERLDVRVRA